MKSVPGFVTARVISLVSLVEPSKIRALVPSNAELIVTLSVTALPIVVLPVTDNVPLKV